MIEAEYRRMDRVGSIGDGHGAIENYTPIVEGVG
jgi:hypothetical protein